MLSWHRQAIKEMESMTPSLTVSAPTQSDYTATSGQKRRLSFHTGGSASKKVCNTAPRRLSAAKTPNTAALPSGGRQPKADHIPALAPGGMTIVRDLKLSNAQTANIGKLGHSEMLALAKAFQVCCRASVVMLLHVWDCKDYLCDRHAYTTDCKMVDAS